VYVVEKIVSAKPRRPDKGLRSALEVDLPTAFLYRLALIRWRRGGNEAQILQACRGSRPELSY
jgi:hypothetical protein